MKKVIEFILAKRCPEDICFEWTKRRSDGCLMDKISKKEQLKLAGAIANKYCNECWANVEKHLESEAKNKK